MEIDTISFVFGAVTAVAGLAVIVFIFAFSSFVKQQKVKNSTDSK